MIDTIGFARTGANDIGPTFRDLRNTIGAPAFDAIFETCIDGLVTEVESNQAYADRFYHTAKSGDARALQECLSEIAANIKVDFARLVLLELRRISDLCAAPDRQAASH